MIFPTSFRDYIKKVNARAIAHSDLYESVRYLGRYMQSVLPLNMLKFMLPLSDGGINKCIPGIIEDGGRSDRA